MTERIGETHDFGLGPGERFEPEENEDVFDLSQPHAMTALGPIPPDDLGFALHHEHVIAYPLAAEDPDLVLDDPEASLAELELYHAAGGRGLVDMSTADYGRDIQAMAMISSHSQVHLVIATGHHKDLYATRYIGDKSINEIAARNIRELTEGIDGTSIRAGVIKAGTSLDEITPVEDRVLRAAARAHLATGAPISTHTEAGSMALEQVAILKEEGVDPSRVIIGHMDRRLDEEYLKSLLDNGVFVSFDQISKERYGQDKDRAAMVKILVDAGYKSQLLLSGDLARKSKLLAYGGEPGWVYLVEQFPLMLMEAGLSAPAIRELFVENTARALTIH